MYQYLYIYYPPLPTMKPTVSTDVNIYYLYIANSLENLSSVFPFKIRVNILLFFV